MSLKTTGSAFIVLSLAIFMMAASDTRADSSTLTILSPTSLQTYSKGDTVQITWSSGLIPSLRQPMTVFLLGPKFKRTRIGSISVNQKGGTYSLTWKIPDAFIERIKSKADSQDYRIEIRSGNELKNRLISATTLIRIQMNIPTTALPSPSTPPKTSNTPSQPNLTLPDRSQLIAHYEFKSLYEAWTVKKLTVVNDSNNDGFDPNPAETTDAIDTVYVRYLDEFGTLKISSAPFAGWKATLSGLDFYIPSRSHATLDLYVDTVDPKLFGQNFSGRVFRVGIQDSANNATTFQAVGQVSGATINNFGSLQINSPSISESVVQSSPLAFAITDPTNAPLSLINGDNTVFDFTISATQASLGRLVFDITQNGLTTLDGAKLFRNGQQVNIGDNSQSGNAYLMWDSGPQSCFAQLSQSGAGTGMDCNGHTTPSAKLILTFSNEEIISGSTAYSLGFNVNGASTGDTVTVRLDHGDDFAKPALTGSDSLNGKIYNAGLDPELFANPTDFASEATSITDRNIIWSDWSADLHKYPQATPALPPAFDSSSSSDWTNGYLLGLNALPAVTSKW